MVGFASNKAKCLWITWSRFPLIAKTFMVHQSFFSYRFILAKNFVSQCHPDSAWNRDVERADYVKNVTKLMLAERNKLTWLNFHDSGSLWFCKLQSRCNLCHFQRISISWNVFFTISTKCLIDMERSFKCQKHVKVCYLNRDNRVK